MMFDRMPTFEVQIIRPRVGIVGVQLEDGPATATSPSATLTGSARTTRARSSWRDQLVFGAGLHITYLRVENG